MSADNATTFDPSTSREPIYKTRMGGYAICRRGQYVWYADIPSEISANVGDPIPREVGLEAANKAARDDQDDPRSSDDSLVYG